jgi:hypothetical protein
MVLVTVGPTFPHRFVARFVPSEAGSQCELPWSTLTSTVPLPGILSISVLYRDADPIVLRS